MAFDPAEEIERFHAAINALDFPAIEAYFAENATYVSNGVAVSPAGLRSWPPSGATSTTILIRRRKIRWWKR